MKNKKLILPIVITLSIFTLAGCAENSNPNQYLTSKTEQNQEDKGNLDKADHTVAIASALSTNDPEANKSIEETNTTNTVTKVAGRRKEFIERLDNIQKELDALPEKKDSDAGVTNAMRNYYGKSYDMYDQALNEIYALLKKELSPETMKRLQTEQIKWIQQKESGATKEASQFKGGTFEFVAYKLSLYQSTKIRCYQLVNEYMTD